MANKAKGEVALVVGEKTYTLVYNMNARAELEDALDMSMMQLGELMQDAANLRQRHIIAIVWAGLRKHHKELTKEMVGDLIDEAGFENAMNAFQKAFHSSVEGMEAANPPKTGEQAKT